MDSEKIDKLLKLHIEIGKKYCEVKENFNVCVNGVFLPPKSKPRFDVVFVGINPSTTGQKSSNSDEIGNWNISKTDKLFQEYLRKYKLEGSYATDFSHFGRAESKTNKITEDELKQFADFFVREIEIIQPKIIVCFGDKSYRLVLGFIKDNKIKILKFWHPGASKRGHGKDKLLKKWDEQFHKLKANLPE